MLPGLDFRETGAGTSTESVLLPMESLPIGPGDMGFALLLIHASYKNHTLRAGVSTTAHAEGHMHLQTTLIINRRVKGFLNACDQEFSYRQ